MTIHAFDTLRFAERLEKVGLPREQAAEFSKTLGDFMQEKLVTKEDLINLATKEDLTKITTELRGEMRWLFGATTSLLILIMAAFKFFH